MKKYTKIIFSLIVAFMTVGMLTISNAATPTQTEINEFINSHSGVDPDNLTTEEVVEIYDDLTKQYTNEELADALEQNSRELQKAGVDKEVIDTGATILRTTDTDELRKVLENTDIDELKAELESASKSGTSIAKLPSGAILLMIQLLLANKIVKTVLIISVIIALYMIIVRWSIYRKAGKHGWAAIIPIYRDIVWLKVAGISPWVLLLTLIPVIGWAILAIIFLVSKFTLPKQFGRSAGWGIGILILPIIFESVVAFSSGFEYQGDK